MTAIPAAIEAAIEAFATAVEAAVHAIAGALQARSTRRVAIGEGVIGTTVVTLFDAVAAMIETLFDAITEITCAGGAGKAEQQQGKTEAEGRAGHGRLRDQARQAGGTEENAPPCGWLTGQPSGEVVFSRGYDAAQPGHGPTGTDMSDGFVALYIFMLAAIAGNVIISRVPVILHTPLMSGSNFIHGIVLIGGIVVLGHADSTLERAIGFVAVLLGAGNAAGGYVVTERMLDMFKSSRKPGGKP